MSRSLARVFTPLIPILFAGAIAASEERAEPQTTGSQIDEWIAALNSESFVRRDFASQRLITLGEAAVAPLLQTAGGERDTAAQSAVCSLQQLALDERDAVATAAHQGLVALLRRKAPLSGVRRRQVSEAVRRSERAVAAVITTVGGTTERDESLMVRVLQVNDDRFGDRQALLLPRLTELVQLDVRDSQITNAAIESIRTLRNLEELNLADTAVSGTGLLRLTSLNKLKKLTIYRLSVTAEEFDQLKVALPDCDIRW